MAAAWTERHSGIERSLPFADRTCVNPFWLIDEASSAGVRAVQSEAELFPSGSAQSTVPFLAQIEQVLGEETEPDTAFFVDSWTVGLAAASENFLRRQEERKIRSQEASRPESFSPFTPFFVNRIEAAAEAAWPLPEAKPHSEAEADDRHSVGAFAIEGPLTPETACRLLGVTATSTREQIKAAYRRMAGRYHPDRLTGRGAQEQKLASDRMASINEAYRLLCA